MYWAVHGTAPQQTNAVDSGVCCCVFMKAVGLGFELPQEFPESYLQDERRRIWYEILTGQVEQPFHPPYHFNTIPQPLDS